MTRVPWDLGPDRSVGFRSPVGDTVVSGLVVRTMVRGLVRGVWVRSVNGVLVRPGPGVSQVSVSD